MAYKVLIIGCGAIAGGYDAERSPEEWPVTHAGAVARDDCFELVACVDPDQSALEAFATRWDVPQSAPSIDALEAPPGSYDLIVIASPTAHHADHLRAALSLKPRCVFCEKPLAPGTQVVADILEEFREAGIPLAVNYTRRWAPDLIDLASGWRSQWGPFLSAVGTYSKGIVHNGGHLIDLIQMILGPQEIYAVGPAVFDHWYDDPSVTALLWHQSCVSTIHLVTGDSRAFTQFELVLTFEKGEVAIRDGGMRIETRRVIESTHAAGHRQLSPAESAPGRYPEAMAAAYDNLAQAMETGAPLASDGDSAASTLAICEEIRRRALNRKDTGPTPMKQSL